MILLLTIVAVALIVGLFAWYLWRQSINAALVPATIIEPLPLHARILSGLLIMLFTAGAWHLVAHGDDRRRGSSTSIVGDIRFNTEAIENLRLDLQLIDARSTEIRNIANRFGTGGGTQGVMSVLSIEEVGVGTLPPFAPGEACDQTSRYPPGDNFQTGDVIGDMAAEINALNSQQGVVAILLVGSHDARPLNDNVLAEFGSNGGLATIRAECVRRALQNHRLPDVPLTSLWRGPGTPTSQASDKILERDRTPQVYVVLRSIVPQPVRAEVR